MSSDSPKPFDAPPAQTPDLLQKEMKLDRRAPRPSEAPTDPMRPMTARPAEPTQLAPRPPVPPNLTARPAQVPPATAPMAAQPPAARSPVAAPQPAQPPAAPARAPLPPAAQPQAQVRAPLPPAAAPAPMAQPARAAIPPFAEGRAPLPPAAAPAPTAQPARAAIPPSAEPQVRAPLTAQPARAAVQPSAEPHVRAPLPPAAPAPTAQPVRVAIPPSADVRPTEQPARAAVQPTEPQAQVRAAPAPSAQAPAPGLPGVAAPPRTAPPSPVQYAQSRPLPQVTPLVPSQGAVIPEGQHQTTSRAVGPAPAARAAQPPVAAPVPSQHVELELPTNPAMPVQRPVITTPTAPVRTAPLPPELLVTQPGLPGPFAGRHLQPNPAVPERPQSLPEVPAVQPATVAAAAQPDGDTVVAEPAALWRRVGAWLTDLVFISALVLGLLTIATMVIAPKHLTPLQQLQTIALPGVALAAILAFVYTTIFAFLWDGRTPGRRAMGIHLVDTTGHAPAPLRALARAMLSLVSFALFLTGFWLALFDRHGQTLHDKLTRTFVVKLQDA